jgi:hypothetical protein
MGSIEKKNAMQEVEITDSEWVLIPYIAIDGIPTMSDSFIRSLFVRMEDEKLEDIVFHQGEINSPEKFLEMMKFGKNSLYVIVRKGSDRIPEKDDMGGVVWLNYFQARKAYFHFCFFSNIRGAEAITVGQYAVLYLLNMKNDNEEFLFDVLIGVVPETNVLARRWCDRMGFGKAGIVPSGEYIATFDKSVSSHIYYAERGEYHGRR